MTATARRKAPKQTGYDAARIVIRFGKRRELLDQIKTAAKRDKRAVADWCRLVLERAAS